MRAWQQAYLGLRRLPPELTDFEIQHFFTLSPADRRAIRSRYTKNHRIAVALQIGFLRMTGQTMSGIDRMPARLLAHLCQQLGVPAPDLATLRALYRRQRTRFEHRSWAMEVTGFRDYTANIPDGLYEECVQDAISGFDVMRVAGSVREGLYERRVAIPSSRAVMDIARGIHSEVQASIGRYLCERIPADVRSKWLAAVTEVKDGRAVLLEDLQTVPTRISPQTISDQMARVRRLHELGVREHHPGGVSLPLIQGWARHLRYRRPARFRAMSEPRRTLEVVAYLAFQLQSHTDRLIRMIDHEIVRISARAAREAMTLRQQVALRSLKALADIQGIADDGSASAKDRLDRIQMRLADFGRIEPVHYRSRAALQRYLLATRPNRIPELLRHLNELRLTTSSDARLLTRLHVLASPEAATPDPAAIIDSLPRAWKAWADAPQKDARRASEAATAVELRRALRRGSTACPTSLRYRDRADILECGREILKARGRPAISVDACLTELHAHLAAGLEAVQEAVGVGDLEIDGATLRLKALPKEQPESDPDAFKRAVDQALHRTTLSEILVEIDAATRFSTVLLGRAPTSAADLRYVYAGLLAHGTELTPARLSLMVPDTDAEAIGEAMVICEDANAMRRANESIVGFLRSHPVVSAWGRGTECAADMMSLDVSRHVWAARTDPRRRTWAIGTYTHVLDQWCVIHDQPIVLNQRQAGAAIEGLLGHRELQPERVAVDTHGYTYMAFAIAKHLGRDLCPRLRNIKERVLFLPSDFKVPAELEPVSRCNVSLDTIRRGWDDLLALVDAIRGGEISATLALERFGSVARGHPAYDAGVAYGKLLRTLYLCDYFSNRPFRREILRLLNHGEALHALQRQIHAGAVPPLQGRGEQEQIAMSGSLALLTNAVLAWNTHRIQQAMDAHRHAAGKKPPPALLRQISPARHAHINFRGILWFPIEKFAGRLLTGLPPPPGQAGSNDALQR